jgi:SHO1 osmosensor
MYAYQADPADPNEVSFEKGAQLEVLDATGKWFQVRTQGGQTGVSTGKAVLIQIAPSNYLTLL